MAKDDFYQQARDLCSPFRVDDGDEFQLSKFEPGDTLHLDADDKSRAKDALERGIEVLAELQERLYAHDQWGLLLIFQAMDAAGKDSAIKHVMSGINPQGCHVSSFKAPTSDDLDHDYLWRCMKRLPERGRIGIFNRSYYEETLIVRVHPEFLQKQKLPRKLITDDIWTQRFADIRHFEDYLTHNGYVIRKFFLNVSKKEQKKRFLERLDRPEKNWKFSLADVKEREHWDDYMRAYDETIRHTASPQAPWFVVPADRKWFTRLVVAAAVIDALHSLDLKFPSLDDAQRAELETARQELDAN